jgi:hypothetical protein
MQPQPGNLPTLQIICAAMLGGILIFMGVACFLASNASAPEGLPLSRCATIIGALAVGLLVARFLVANNIRHTARRAAEAGPDRDAREAALLPHFFSLTLITMAMLEGLAFLGLVFLMLTGEWWLLVAPLAAIALAVPFAPTRGRFDAFMQEVSGR